MKVKLIKIKAGCYILYICLFLNTEYCYPEREENHPPTSRCRFKIDKINELCYVLTVDPCESCVLFSIALKLPGKNHIKSKMAHIRKKYWKYLLLSEINLVLILTVKKLSVLPFIPPHFPPFPVN